MAKKVQRALANALTALLIAPVVFMACSDEEMIDASTNLDADTMMNGDAGVNQDATPGLDAKLDDDASTADGSGLDADTSDAGTSTTGMDAGLDAGTPDTGIIVVPVCVKTCAMADDCVAAGANEATDADNWACNQSRCEPLGCNNTQECVDAYGATFICAQPPGSSLPDCFRSCSVVGDCAGMGAPPLYDVDNYACVSSACQFLGCNNTQECTDTLSNPNSVCEPFPTLNYDFCAVPCGNAAECATPVEAFNEDNYACDNSRCRYTGCLSATECNNTFADGNYVCE